MENSNEKNEYVEYSGYEIEKDSIVYDLLNKVQHEIDGTDYINEDGIDYAKYEEVKEKSLNGSNGIRTNQKKEISIKKHKMLMKAAIVVTAIAVAGIVTFSNKMIDEHNDRKIIDKLSEQYGHELIDDNWHDVKGGYAIDYDKIGAQLLKQENFDEALYFLYLRENLETTNKVLNTINYPNLEEYIKRNNYEDLEEWEKAMEKQAVLRANLDEMRQGHEEEVPIINGGGIK